MEGEYSFPSQAEDTQDFFMAFALTENDSGGEERFDDPRIVSLKAYYHTWDTKSVTIVPLAMRTCTKEELGLNQDGKYDED
jgi:hypothetical protein